MPDLRRFLPLGILLISLSACSPPGPNVHFLPSAQENECVTAPAADFQAAFENMQFERASAVANDPGQQQIAALARQVIWESSATFPKNPATNSDSTLAFQWKTLRTADAWIKDDFATIAGISEDDPQTAGLAAAWGSSTGKEVVHFASDSFQIPLYRSNTGNPIIDVVVNGIPFRFWLDTGAGVNVIASQVADAVGMQSVGSSADIGTSTKKKVSAGPAFIDSLRIGELSVFNHPAVILRKQDLIIRFLGIPLVRIDGIIGWPLLKQLDLAIDFPNEQLVIRKPRSQPKAGRPLGWFWQPIMQLRTADGCPLFLKLDTGAGATSFYPGAHAKLGVQPSKSGKTMMGGAGGTQMMRYEQLDSVLPRDR
jgi:predicted aspartyl protease